MLLEEESCEKYIWSFLFLSPVMFALILFLLDWINEQLGLKEIEFLFFNWTA